MTNELDDKTLAILGGLEARAEEAYARAHPEDSRHNPHEIQKRFASRILSGVAQFFRLDVAKLRLIEGGAMRLEDGSLCFLIDGPERKRYLAFAPFNGIELEDFTFCEAAGIEAAE